MGYDMYFVRKPDGEVVAKDAARDQFHAAVKERDALPEGSKGNITIEEFQSGHSVALDATPEYKSAQAKVDHAYEAMYAAERSYFRFNVWGMSNARRAMEATGMGYEVPRAERGEWPDRPDADVNGEIEEALDEGADTSRFADEDIDAVRAYIAKRRELLSARTPGRLGIPLYKFGSNDGWVVTPGESLEALAIWHGLPEEDREAALTSAEILGEDWLRKWGQWLDYLRLSTEFEGFEVH